MSAQGIAARMVAKHGVVLAQSLVQVRKRRAFDGYMYDGRNARHHEAHWLLWRAVSTALGRMEASV